MRNYKLDTGGLRNEKPLTQKQINESIEYAVKINSVSPRLYMPPERIRYSEQLNISYGAEFDVLYLGTDTYPIENTGTDTKSSNSRISWKGSIAHELIGHREASLKGWTQSDKLFEEAQASIRAARFAFDLSEPERITLLRDAVYRLNKNGYSISEVRELLNIKER